MKLRVFLLLWCKELGRLGGGPGWGGIIVSISPRFPVLVRTAAVGSLLRRFFAVRALVRLGVTAVLLGAPAAICQDGAAAAQPTSLSSRISSLEAVVTAGATRVHAATVAYEEASTAASVLAQQVASATAQAAVLSSRRADALSALRSAALAGYVGDLSAPPPGRVSAELGQSLTDTYLSVVVGNISGALAAYQVLESQVSSATATLRGDLKAADEATAAAAKAQSAAVSAASSADSELAVLQSDLQAAERQAAFVPSPSTQGVPLSDGLVRVLTPVIPEPAASASSPTKAQLPPSPAFPPSTAGGVWAELRNCESGGNYSADTGNGFYGAYQFTQQTWTDLGMPGSPNQASPAMQDAAAQKLQAAAGWGQWPACAAALGLH